MSTLIFELKGNSRTKALHFRNFTSLIWPLGRNDVVSIHTIVPGKILLVGAPCSMALDATPLHRYGVVIVLQLDASSCDPTYFADSGIEVCGADSLGHPTPADKPLAAGALDRFVELVRTAGGAVAIHCAPERLPQACTLAAAWMSTLDLFPSPEAAAAWIAIARAAPAPVDLAALRRHWSRRWLANSHSAPTQTIAPGVSADPVSRDARPGGPAAARRQLLSRDGGGAFARTCPELPLRRAGNIHGHIAPARPAVAAATAAGAAAAAAATAAAAASDRNPSASPPPPPPPPSAANPPPSARGPPRPAPPAPVGGQCHVGRSASGWPAVRPQPWTGPAALAGPAALVAAAMGLLPPVLARVLPLLLLALLLLPPFPPGILVAALVALGSALLLLLPAAAALGPGLS